MSDAIAYVKDLSFEYGVLERLTPNVRRLIANNPGPFTHVGSGTYVIGQGRVAIVDPGPELAEHTDALLAGLRGEEVTHILVTHTHVDHSPGARALQAKTGAPTYGFGPHASGRYQRGEEVEAGADLDFVPDVVLRDSEVIEGDNFQIEAVHTPGHCSNHLCFELRQERALFTGDHVMAWATTVISPPDGDMGHYLGSLSRLLRRDDMVYYPTHGASIDDPKRFVDAYIKHRKNREEQVLDCLDAGLIRIEQMLPVIYAAVPVFLYPAAARSVFAHMLHLIEQGRVQTDGAPSLDAAYRRT
ncbi:MAG TPA: MBL fold metallo-hydrolase [Polyangiales bacterium]